MEKGRHPLRAAHVVRADKPSRSEFNQTGDVRHVS